MALSTKAIENFSVNAVRDSIMMSEYLDQFIPDNDKEPFWDGAVYIYNTSKHTNANFRGRMPVQVKGTECNDFSKEEISYSVRTADLRSYLADGGAVYFVVYVGNGGLTRKIYYVELTPIRIQVILDEAKQQATKTIKLKAFPDDNNQKATIFMNCLQNCQKQASFANTKLFSLEDLQKLDLVEGLTIPLAGVGLDKDPQMALISNDVYMYVNVKGSAIPHPIKSLPVSKHTREEVEANVTIEGTQYYDKISIVKSADNVQYIFGKSFSLTTEPGKEAFRINYKNSDDIRVLAKDLTFLLAYIEKGYFDINGHRCPFDYQNANLSNFNEENQKGIAKFARQTVTVLDTLSCSKTLSVNALSGEDIRNLNRLYTGLIEKKPVTGLKENLPFVSLIKVSDLNIAVVLHPQTDQKNTYVIEDFFTAELMASYQGRNGRLPMSQFAILTIEDLLKIDNIKWNAFLTSFQKVEQHEETFDRANWFMLSLLSAYDQSGRKEFLQTAQDFSNWILTSTDEEMSYEVKMLNHLQIIKRLRAFTQEETRTLYEIVAKQDAPESILTGAYLLLDQHIPAEMHFNKMQPEEQEEFTDYPIYHFWKKEEE